MTFQSASGEAVTIKTEKHEGAVSRASVQPVRHPSCHPHLHFCLHITFAPQVPSLTDPLASLPPSMTVSTIAQSQLNQQQQQSSSPAANVKLEQQSSSSSGQHTPGSGASPHHHMFSPAQQFAQQQFSPQVDIPLSHTFSHMRLILSFPAAHEPDAAAVQSAATDPPPATASPLATAVPTSPPSPADQPHATAAAATATAVATLAVAAATGPG